MTLALGHTADRWFKWKLNPCLSNVKACACFSLSEVTCSLIVLFKDIFLNDGKIYEILSLSF